MINFLYPKKPDNQHIFQKCAHVASDTTRMSLFVEHGDERLLATWLLRPAVRQRGYSENVNISKNSNGKGQFKIGIGWGGGG